MFFRKSPPPLYATLGLDMHSHILPGIDDGAPDVPTAVALVKELIRLGYQELIATPHVLTDLHPNTPATIREALANLQQGLEEADIHIPVSAAAEYMIDETFHELLRSDAELMTLPHQHILVELPQAGEPPRWEEAIFRLQTKGYRPILAHPERYRYLAGDFDRFTQLQENGVGLQLNLLSLSGYYGAGPERSGKELLKRGLADYLGTDLHHDRHRHALEVLARQKRLVRQLHQHQWRNHELAFSPSTPVEQTTH